MSKSVEQADPCYRDRHPFILVMSSIDPAPMKSLFVDFVFDTAVVRDLALVSRYL